MADKSPQRLGEQHGELEVRGRAQGGEGVRRGTGFWREFSGKRDESYVEGVMRRPIQEARARAATLRAEFHVGISRSYGLNTEKFMSRLTSSDPSCDRAPQLNPNFLISEKSRSTAASLYPGFMPPDVELTQVARTISHRIIFNIILPLF